MPIPLDVRKKPTSLKVHISTGEGVDIAWADAHTSHYDFPYLRDSCPCAMCNDEREQKAKAGPAAAVSAVLPMYKPPRHRESRFPGRELRDSDPILG